MIVTKKKSIEKNQRPEDFLYVITWLFCLACLESIDNILFSMLLTFKKLLIIVATKTGPPYLVSMYGITCSTFMRFYTLFSKFQKEPN